MADSNYTLLLSIFAFLGIVALIEGVYLLWRNTQTVSSSRAKKRLRKLSAAGVPVDKVPSLLRREVLSSNPVLNTVYMSIPRLHMLDRVLERSNLRLTLTRFFLIQLGLGLVVFLIFIFMVGTGPGLSLLVAALIGILAPYFYVKHKANRRIADFNQQLPDAIDFIARSLRAGNPFSASLKAASQDMQEPLASEFGTTFDEIRYGVDIENALLNLYERTDSEEIKFFVTAVLVQRTTGGNLAKILDRLSAVMRARATTIREVHVLSTEMRYSANILIFLPFIVALGVMLIDPGYLSLLFQSKLGLMIVYAQLFLMLIGYLVIKKMVNFRV